jgi:hypothetical protein
MEPLFRLQMSVLRQSADGQFADRLNVDFGNILIVISLTYY